MHSDIVDAPATQDRHPSKGVPRVLAGRAEQCHCVARILPA